MAKTKNLSITQIKSQIGYKKKAKLTLKARGLRKMNQTVHKKNSAAIRGMIDKVSFLVKVEES